MISSQEKVKVGNKVYYQPSHYPKDKWENGVIKEIPGHTTTSIRVVYNCAGEWDRYMDFTSALTDLRDLFIGWKHAGSNVEAHLQQANDKIEAQKTREENCEEHYFVATNSKWKPLGMMTCTECGKVIND